MHVVLRPIWLRVGVVAILEVPGRVTGAPVRVPVGPWEVDGEVDEAVSRLRLALSAATEAA